MGKIKILNDILIDKIAAGEIVERPSSIVKELIENSIDSGSSSIMVEITKGGKEKIRVDDDGEGMDREDLILALERHATSKILNEKDLCSISTMGFRGEALPSIASVSIVTMRSGRGLALPGHEVHAKGGKILNVEEVPPLKGTSVEVRSIFFNTPARNKFLKSNEVELSHIIAAIQRLALSFYELRFTLKSKDRLLFSLSPSSSRRERISQIFGSDFASRLLQFSITGEAVELEGFISNIGDGRSNRSGQNFFVNRRSIKDRTLMGAAYNAYRSFFPGSHPYLFLFLEVNPSLVDFNVHPAKLEVRFRHLGEIYRIVHNAILSVLEGEKLHSASARLSPSMSRQTGLHGVAHHGSSAERASTIKISEMQVQEEVPFESRSQDIKILGQHLNTFIVATDSENLFIIDQHIAHERVVFEELNAQLQRGTVERQKLLFPMTIELTPAESSCVKAHQKILFNAGLIIDDFGPGTIKVTEIPTSLPLNSIPGFIKEVISSLLLEDPEVGCETMTELLSMLACHAAVKAGERLAAAKMEYIVESLLKCSNPYYCPHGRPITVKLGPSELMKQFKRRE
ncbi:MAG: DNA mismatch repair endonuclease MutL [Acidobacteriota bacterium]